MKLVKYTLLAAIAASFVTTAHAVNTRIAGGKYHTVFIDPNENVYAVGRFTEGQLGPKVDPSSTNVEQNSKQTVPVYTGISNAKSVAAGIYSSFILTKDGRVLMFGRDYGNVFGMSPLDQVREVKLPGPVFDVAVSYGDAYFLVQEGTYTANGFETPYGSLYHWNLSDSDTNPVATKVTDAPQNIVMISSGGFFLTALTELGEVYTWGSNSRGQLGIGHNQPSPGFNGPILSNIRYIEAGYEHALAIQTDGTVWAWGDGSNGQLGQGSTISSYKPVKVLDIVNAVRVGANSDASYAVLDDGTVKMWGWHNLIGGGGGYNRNYRPATLTFPNKVLFVGDGDSYTTLMDVYGKAYGWGGNLYGQLALGHTQETHEVAEFLPPANAPRTVTAVAATATETASGATTNDTTNQESNDTTNQESDSVATESVKVAEMIDDYEPDKEPEDHDHEKKIKNDRGHGNNSDHQDDDNPGKGHGGPNAKQKDGNDEDERQRRKRAVASYDTKAKYTEWMKKAKARYGKRHHKAKHHKKDRDVHAKFKDRVKKYRRIVRKGSKEERAKAIRWLGKMMKYQQHGHLNVSRKREMLR